jgi:hypothetical protein
MLKNLRHLNNTVQQLVENQFGEGGRVKKSIEINARSNFSP